jgi:hypothetical protein
LTRSELDQAARDAASGVYVRSVRQARPPGRVDWLAVAGCALMVAGIVVVAAVLWVAVAVAIVLFG